MNCKDAGKNALLARAGELSARRAAKLAAHLGECRQCRERLEQHLRVQDIAAGYLPSGEPAETTIARIRSDAAVVAGRPAVTFTIPLARLLVYAALLLALVMGGRYYVSSGKPGGDSSGISDVSAIVAMLSEEEEEGFVDNVSEVGEDTALLHLARQILRIQGLYVERPSSENEASI